MLVVGPAVAADLKKQNIQSCRLTLLGYDQNKSTLEVICPLTSSGELITLIKNTMNNLLNSMKQNDLHYFKPSERDDYLVCSFQPIFYLHLIIKMTVFENENHRTFLSTQSRSRAKWDRGSCQFLHPHPNPSLTLTGILGLHVDTHDNTIHKLTFFQFNSFVFNCLINPPIPINLNSGGTGSWTDGTLHFSRDRN